MLWPAAGCRIFRCMPIGLPHRPQSIDIAVMKVEDRVEGRGRRITHLTRRSAHEAMQPRCAFGCPTLNRCRSQGRSERLDRWSWPMFVEYLSRSAGRSVDRSAGGASQKAFQTQQSSSSLSGSRATRQVLVSGCPVYPVCLRSEVSATHHSGSWRAIWPKEGIGEERAQVRPVPVRHHDTWHVTLQLLLEAVQEVAVPAEEAV
jgi:hypothetical protein